jgi:hypothetical protein
VTTPSQISAGQTVTADAIDAMSRFVSTVACDSVTDSSAETVIATVTIPATDAGLALNGGYELIVFGAASWTGTPTLTFFVRLGSVTGSLLAEIGAGTLTSGGSAVWWMADVRLMISAAGASGTVDCVAQLAAGLTGNGVVTPSGNRGVAVDTAAAVVLVLTAKWGTAATANTCIADVGNLDRI